jgi:multidrug efflux system membrane fusion protein
MKRVWWVTALLVIAVCLVAYNWRGDIAGLFGQADAQVAQAPSPTPGATGRAAAQGRAAGQAGAGASGQAASGAAGRGNAASRGGPGGAGGLPPFEVATAVATTGSLPDQRSTIGWILSANTTNLTTQTAGIVQEIDAVAGTDVKTGDVLVKLDARAANAAITKDKATLQRDQATLTEAQHTADTATALAQKGAGTEDAAQQAETAAAVATATVAVDNAQLAADQVTLDNTVIKAPFDGRIGAFQVAVGSLVQPAGPVVTLTQMAPVDAQFSVSENDLAQLRSAIASGTAKVTATPTDAKQGATGTITFLDSAVDRASGTVQARGTLPNDDRALWPGQSVNISLDLGAQAGLVLVPTVAVVPSTTGSVVYVVKPDGTIDIRNVTVAGTTGDMTGLSNGVQPNEHVVVEGQFNLSSGQRVAEAPANPASRSAPPAGPTANAAPPAAPSNPAPPPAQG